MSLPDGLGVDSLYEFPRNEWIDISSVFSNLMPFPSVDLVLDKQNNAEAAQTIQRYPAAACRINADGLVVMRGLLRTTNGSALGAGAIVGYMPKWLLPRHPQELRWNVHSAVLRCIPDTRELKIDFQYFSSSYINLGNIIYYLD